uniref:TERT n=1 Tax=Arundo donax TaxID=35708 RepID=A0A0A9D549_ARUDO
MESLLFILVHPVANLSSEQICFCLLWRCQLYSLFLFLGFCVYKLEHFVDRLKEGNLEYVHPSLEQLGSVILTAP